MKGGGEPSLCLLAGTSQSRPSTGFWVSSLPSRDLSFPICKMGGEGDSPPPASPAGQWRGRAQVNGQRAGDAGWRAGSSEQAASAGSSAPGASGRGSRAPDSMLLETRRRARGLAHLEVTSTAGDCMTAKLRAARAVTRPAGAGVAASRALARRLVATALGRRRSLSGTLGGDSGLSVLRGLVAAGGPGRAEGVPRARVS